MLKPRICALAVSAILSLQMDAQWLGYPTPGIPGTRDGKANLTARTPRGRDGKPDLSGLWATEAAPADLRTRLIPDVTNAVGEEPLSQYFLNIFADFKPGDEPVRPEETAALHEREAAFSRISPIAHCLPEGMPLVEMAPAPYKIIQHSALSAYEESGKWWRASVSRNWAASADVLQSVSATKPFVSSPRRTVIQPSQKVLTEQLISLA